MYLLPGRSRSQFRSRAVDQDALRIDVVDVGAASPRIRRLMITPFLARLPWRATNRWISGPLERSLPFLSLQVHNIKPKMPQSIADSTPYEMTAASPGQDYRVACVARGGARHNPFSRATRRQGSSKNRPDAALRGSRVQGKAYPYLQVGCLRSATGVSGTTAGPLDEGSEGEADGLFGWGRGATTAHLSAARAPSRASFTA